MKFVSLQAFNWEVTEKQYLCSFVAKIIYTLWTWKICRKKSAAWIFWSSFELLVWTDVKHFGIWSLVFNAQYFNFQLIWWHDSWNDDHCRLRTSAEGYWLKLWRHESELEARQGWWHLSDWMRLLWDGRKWLMSFTFKWHWLWSRNTDDGREVPPKMLTPIFEHCHLSFWTKLLHMKNFAPRTMSAASATDIMYG